MPTLTKNTPFKFFGKQLINVTIPKFLFRMSAMKGKVTLITKRNEVRNRVVEPVTVYMMNHQLMFFVTATLASIFVTLKRNLSVLVKNLWICQSPTSSTNELITVWSRTFYRTLFAFYNVAIYRSFVNIGHRQQYISITAKSKP